MQFLSEAPLDPVSLSTKISGIQSGGVVTFAGTVRNHHLNQIVESLSYSAYPAMAEREAAMVLEEAARKWPVQTIARHRIGELIPGDVAVVVAVASAHRTEAFDACRWVVDQLKSRVPIWKLEHYADGTYQWVDPTALPRGSAVED